jgi:hypothetical protein
MSWRWRLLQAVRVRQEATPTRRISFPPVVILTERLPNGGRSVVRRIDRREFLPAAGAMGAAGIAAPWWMRKGLAAPPGIMAADLTTLSQTIVKGTLPCVGNRRQLLPAGVGNRRQLLPAGGKSRRTAHTSRRARATPPGESAGTRSRTAVVAQLRPSNRRPHRRRPIPSPRRVPGPLRRSRSRLREHPLLLDAETARDPDQAVCVVPGRNRTTRAVGIGRIYRLKRRPNDVIGLCHAPWPRPSDLCPHGKARRQQQRIAVLKSYIGSNQQNEKGAQHLGCEQRSTSLRPRSISRAEPMTTSTRPKRGTNQLGST